MRIATWNVNGLRARLDYVRIWLEARQPDIVGLQELKVSEEEFPASAFDDLGYEVVVYGQKAWNGVAILTRHPAEPTLRGLPGQEDFGARLVGARIAGLTFATVYCPNGKDLAHEDYSAASSCGTTTSPGSGRPGSGRTRRRCCAETSTSSPRRSTPGAARTGTAPSSTRRRSGRGTARSSTSACATSSGRRTATSRHTRGGTTGRAHFPAGTALRIDFLLGTNAIVDRVTNVEIDRDFRKKKEGLTASDHAPVIADLDWPVP